MHKHKFSGYKNSVLHFVPGNDFILLELWENEIKRLAKDNFFLDLGPKKALDLMELIQLGSVYLNQKRLPLVEKGFIKIKEGSLLRFHLNPKRYPLIRGQGTSQIIYEDLEFMVINKLPGIPVHPTLDNAIENVLYQYSVLKKIPLYLVHRLDVETQGLLVLAKNFEIQTQLQNLFARREMHKFYKAIVMNPGLELGLKTHWMINSESAPKILHDDEIENSKLCQLKVLGHEPTVDSKIGKDFNLKLDQDFFTVTIELLTGRTHQIRAQLSHLGFPILGDLLYKGRSHELLALQAHCICFNHPRTNVKYEFTLQDH